MSAAHQVQGDERDRLLRLAREHGVRFVDLQFTDIAGMVKGVTIPVGQLARALDEGIWFDGSSIEGFARVAESDMHLVPDPTTFALIPWLSGADTTARIICDVYTPNGQRSASHPRGRLIAALAEATAMGLEYVVGPEMEFYLLDPPTDVGEHSPQPHDTAGYFDQPTDAAVGLRRSLASSLAAFGIVVEAMHHEVGAGQHEIDFRYAEALRAADHVVTLRVVLKTLASRSGIYGTFVPKPRRDLPGSGMHVHQSLNYIATGANAFADEANPHGLSPLGQSFVAGQLVHARGMCAVVAPLVNSYKRLISGFEAPIYVSWGRINRSALIRVPRAEDPAATRVELRAPDPSCNPYLALAVMLAAGLDGVRRHLAPPDPTDEDLYSLEPQRQAEMLSLPRSLDEALRALEEDRVVCEALGPQVLDAFVHAKRLEWEDYQLEVTRWERERYLGRF